MNWYKQSQSQSSPISIDIEDWLESMKDTLYDLVSFSEQEQERLANFSFSLPPLVEELKQLNFPNIDKLVLAVQNDDYAAINEIAWEVDNLGSVVIKPPKGESIQDYNKNYNQRHQLYDRYRNVAKQLHDLWQKSIHEHSQSYNQEQAEKDLAQMTQETKNNMGKVTQSLQQAISRIQNWNNTPIVVMARTYDKQNELGPQDDADVEFIREDGLDNPSFTYFVLPEGYKTKDGNVIEIEDVLEANDDNFFVDPKVQSDYFNLVQELRKPGSTSRGGKIMTLYTARPAEDRELYMDATTVPNGTFLTSQYDSAEGISRDMGKRDIWKIRIDSRYLLQTLDTPTERQYQVVGPDQVPIMSMTLLSPAE